MHGTQTAFDHHRSPELLNIPTLHVADIELPRELEKLYELAYNLWWSWSPEATGLFAAIDSASWGLYRNPVQMLINIEPRHWYHLLENEEFLARFETVMGAFAHYMSADRETWLSRQDDGGTELIAYFSMEYGLHPSLAIYSGGLGVLSGDHLKSASDLGLPFVAVGLLYRHGYFQQTIDAEGVQQHFYPEYDFTRLPLRPIASGTGREILVSIPLPGREVRAKLWLAQVGRVPLILLDTDIPENHPADRPITNTLYVRGREMRLTQEMVLGVGGAKALAAVGLEPTVWHLNEGHSVFLQLERLRKEILEHETTFEEARARVSRNAVFTTHTPVEAGNERFATALVEKYLAPWCEEVRLPVGDLLALGRAHDGDEPFNLTAFAIRTSSFVNGVSRLNAEVTSAMWRHLFPTVAGEQPIRAITNGVHTPTWVGNEMRQLFGRRLGTDWESMLFDGDGFERILEVPDVELWAAHRAQKERLGRFTGSRLREQLARHGESPDTLRVVDTFFDPRALTLGFARRFATYKRAKLIFTDIDRLRRLVCDSERPIQFLFAGKAHPADRPGQELIQSIFKLSRGSDFAGRVFFLENYDMRMGRMLVQGVDVWLNNPRRPHEASGTSGQKAALNGVLNCSILDGWWPEGYNGRNGWAIGSAEGVDDEAEQDRLDVESFYQLLEGEMLPAYYERDADGLPRRWLAMMKESIATLTWRFSTSRMVKDYTELGYLPAARRFKG